LHSTVKGVFGKAYNFDFFLAGTSRPISDCSTTSEYGIASVLFDLIKALEHGSLKLEGVPMPFSTIDNEDSPRNILRRITEDEYYS